MIGAVSKAIKRLAKCKVSKDIEDCVVEPIHHIDIDIRGRFVAET